MKLVITVDKVEEISSRKYKILFFFSIGEKWGTAFGEDGGRIISAKVQVSRFVWFNSLLYKHEYLVLV